MSAPTPGKILRVHISERDRYNGKPLYEAIVDKCRELHVAGATVYRGHEGFGDNAEIHRAHLLTHDLPIVISVVDTAESIARIVPVIEDLMDKGLIAISDVEMIRIQRSVPKS